LIIACNCDLLRLRVLQLDVEQAALGVEHFDIAGVAVVVAQARGSRVLLQCLDLAFCACSCSRVRSWLDERVIDFAEGLLDGLLVSKQRLLLRASAACT
jgi:hypothetical protein